MSWDKHGINQEMFQGIYIYHFITKHYKSGRWFGTFFFPYIGNSHPNWLSYFSEGLKPPTRNHITKYGGFHFNISLAVGLKRSDYFPWYMSSATHWLSYFSRRLKPPTSSFHNTSIFWGPLSIHDCQDNSVERLTLDALELGVWCSVDLIIP